MSSSSNIDWKFGSVVRSSTSKLKATQTLLRSRIVKDESRLNAMTLELHQLSIQRENISITQSLNNTADALQSLHFVDCGVRAKGDNDDDNDYTLEFYEQWLESFQSTSANMDDMNSEEQQNKEKSKGS